jgi:DNA-binding beta-propeller fold protein YncE
VIDIAINAVVATVPVGSSPFGVAVHAGIRARLRGELREQHGLRHRHGQQSWWLPRCRWGSTPAGIAVDSAGARVYVVCTGSNAVYVIDTATNTYFSPATQVGSGADGIAGDARREPGLRDQQHGRHRFGDRRRHARRHLDITIGQFPAGIAIKQRRDSRVCRAPDPQRVTVIDITTNTVLTDVNVIANTVGIAVNPAGTRVYVGNFSGNDVSRDRRDQQTPSSAR